MVSDIDVWMKARSLYNAGLSDAAIALRLDISEKAVAEFLEWTPKTEEERYNVAHYTAVADIKKAAHSALKAGISLDSLLELADAAVSEAAGEVHV